MSLTPYLYYRDVAAAMRFLSKAFGFRVFGPRTKDRAGKVNHAAMRMGTSVVMLGSPPSAFQNPKELGQATQCLVMTVRDIDNHYLRAVRAGAQVLQEPTDTPFGTRRYGVTDVEGHEWYFSQKIRRRPAKAKRRRAAA